MAAMSEINPGWFSLGWQVLVTICSVGGAIVVLWATLNFARRRELETVAQSFTLAQQDQDERLTRIEEQLKHVPRHADLVALSQQVGELATRVARMEGEAARTNNLLEAIHDHLLNAKE
jgi:hypothetical protein